MLQFNVFSNQDLEDCLPESKLIKVMDSILHNDFKMK